MLMCMVVCYVDGELDGAVVVDVVDVLFMTMCAMVAMVMLTLGWRVLFV